jgi:hypothetical protein
MVQYAHCASTRKCHLNYHKIFASSLLLLLVLQLTACGGEPTPVATATPALTPLQIAARSAEAMLAIDALHFVIERAGALVYIDASQLLAFKRAEGDFVQPDRLRATVRVITAITPVEIGMIVLGTAQYATDPFTGQWDILPSDWGQFNLAVLFDPERGLRGLLRDGIFDLVLVGTGDVIEGQRHYHLAGRANGERMQAMTLGFIGYGDVELEVWVGSEDFYVRRLSIVEIETDPNDPTTWNLEFSRLGQPVEIKAPPLSNS